MKKYILLIPVLFIFIILVIYFMWPFVANVDIELIGESKLAESIIKEREELIKAGYISNYYQSSPLVITSNKEKKWYEERWIKKLPNIDFSDNYLYISSSRRIKKIIAFLAYKNFELDYTYGKITYYDEYCKDKAYIYKTDKIKVHYVRDKE